MKRTATTNPKFKKLAKALDVPFFGAVGVCELLWHFTAQNAPRGDVGRWDDEEIAHAVRWSGDAKSLISGLISSGLLDVSEEHRLLVHDWHEHCDQSVKRTVEAMGYGFCVKTKRKLVRNSSGTKRKLASRVNGLAFKETSRVALGRGGAGGETETEFDQFWKAYPRREGKGAARLAFEKATEKKSAAEIIATAELFAASPKGQGDFCPYPATWLNQGRYDDDPAEWQRTGTPNGNRPGKVLAGPGQVHEADRKRAPGEF